MVLVRLSFFRHFGKVVSTFGGTEMVAKVEMMVYRERVTECAPELFSRPRPRESSEQVH